MEPLTSPSHNQPEYSVSELSRALKRTVEETYGYIRIRGEISGLKQAASGHMYLKLKDDSAVLDAVCWKGVSASLPFKPEDGLEVICTGRITTYAARSNYQLVIERMEPSGVGALMALLEKRKKMFEKEGLFDAKHKQKLPSFPTSIGVVTSPTGAVIQDILHRLSERFPCHVTVWPVLVQGDMAAEQIAHAIKQFHYIDTPPDLLIIARGGGSIEDLWPFNEEIVVRAAADATIPLISAVGHETDVTLIDYVADVRAPTPTAAAEMAVPVRAEFLQLLSEYHHRLVQNTHRTVKEYGQYLEGLKRGLISPSHLIEMKTQHIDMMYEKLSQYLPKLYLMKEQALLKQASLLKHPQDLLQRKQEHLTRLDQQLHHAFSTTLDKKKHALHIASTRYGTLPIQTQQASLEEKLSGLARLLDSFHYKHVLKRGYALVRDDKQCLVTSAESAEHHDLLTIEFEDGSVSVSSKHKKAPPVQEELF